jgi:hypothetical protein
VLTVARKRAGRALVDNKFKIHYIRSRLEFRLTTEPTKVVSSPAGTSPKCCDPKTCGSAGMARGLTA